MWEHTKEDLVCQQKQFVQWYRSMKKHQQYMFREKLSTCILIFYRNLSLVNLVISTQSKLKHWGDSGLQPKGDCVEMQ